MEIEAIALVWDEPARDLTGFDAIIFRSCWDYHLKQEAFLTLLDRLESDRIRVMNSPAIVRWNMNKLYLLELEKKGVPIPKTYLVTNGTTPLPGEIEAVLGTTNAICKPVISMSAHKTVRLNLPDPIRLSSAISESRDLGGLLVQEFIPEVIQEGEVSLLFFGGRYSHSVRKKPRQGDFRVQLEHGGSTEPFQPTQALIEQAQEILKLTREELLYARVDGVISKGRFVLMELELIDPFLFLTRQLEAARNFAHAIAARING